MGKKVLRNIFFHFTPTFEKYETKIRALIFNILLIMIKFNIL